MPFSMIFFQKKVRQAISFDFFPKKSKASHLASSKFQKKVRVSKFSAAPQQFTRKPKFMISTIKNSKVSKFSPRIG